MKFEPRSIDLRALFHDPAMFDSRAAWTRAGFQVIAGSSPTACMVAAHPSAPGYLFKKFTSAVSRRDQDENYEARVEGARRLAKLIRKKKFRHVAVPKKSLHDLPRIFGKRARILVVEHLDVLDHDATALRYRDIAERALRELMTMIAKFRGLDSTILNVPFLRDGRVAFIDLEHWSRKKRTRLKTIGGYLTAENRDLALKLLDER